MQCDICHRAASSRLPFNCTICARNALYHPRIQHAQILLQKEALEQEVEQIARRTSSVSTKAPSSTIKAPQENLAWTIQCATAEQILSDEKTQTILGHVQSLREESQKMKVDIAARRARLIRRRSEFLSAKQALSHTQDSSIEPVEKGIRRTAHRWEILHNKTAESRVFLCKEAAQLYGLQQHRRKKGAPGRDVYAVGGVPIVDLRDLNNASPSQITTSTTILAHLVHLASHYLSLKLPAEITLPHRDYPLPTIFSPSSSYSHRSVPFPGSTPSHSSANSPSASRHTDHRPLPRPRPLHLDKKLSALAKDDQIAYASFMEGITLLAWDIAWLCRTQGLPTGSTSWEEICAMGRNAHQLLLAPPSRPPPSSRDPPRKPTPPTDSASPTITHTKQKDLDPPPPRAHLSHGTHYGYLNSAAGTEYMRAWRLASPVKAIEKVKAMLLAERTGAEWEILEGAEWEDDEAPADRDVQATGVLVTADPVKREGAIGYGRDPEALDGEWKTRGGGGANGWMKVKSR